MVDKSATLNEQGILGIDDSTVELAAKAARQIGLPHNLPAAAQLTRRKDLARAHLAQAGCPIPLHWLINLDLPLQQQMADIKFPCVIKPLALSGSRGIIRANNQQELITACKAYGLRTGPVHAELRVNGAQAWILEVAARTIGGDCARCLDNGDEFNFEKLVISLAVNREYRINPPTEARGVMMIPIKQPGILRRVEGLSDANRVEHIENIDIIIRSGNELITLPEGNQYPGYIFARADTPQEVVAALRQACEKLNFVVAPIFNTMVVS